jgi:Domain of unknown function (DUF4115)
VVVIVAIAVVVTVALFAWLDRPRHDSVAEYHRAIETLREIAERPGQIPGERVADAPAFVATGFGAMVSTRRAIAGIAVLAAVGVAAFAAVDRPGASPHGLSPARTEVAAGARPTRPRPTATTAPVTTTTTSPAVPRVVVSAAGNATVAVAFPVTLTIRATAPCWVQASDESGRVVYQATLQPGQEQEIPAGGPLVVRLGNTTAVEVSVGDARLALTGIGNTADLTLAAG